MFHRRAWVLSGTCWCPDCGAVRPYRAPLFARWAYPGDVDKAGDAMVTWYREPAVKESLDNQNETA